MVAPATGFCCASVTTPLSAPVVTPCANNAAGVASAQNKIRACAPRISHIAAFGKQFIKLSRTKRGLRVESISQK